MQRPFMLWPLISVLLLLALGGFYGGIAMLADPTGVSLQLSDVLPLLPVPNFILPGIFLLIVMGLLPLQLAYALISRPNWPWVDSLFKWSKYYWAWTGTLSHVAILGVWLVYEGMVIGWFPITYFTAALGSLILIFSLLPGVRKFYAR